ncbi:MAG: tyrosine--tRNA ligase [Planctomycetes bacterium]|nr:tyrosine--tRNA ligase [Planctomycetota bacterium]
MPNFAPVDEQLTDLLRGAEDVISEGDLRKRLGKSAETGTPLRVKLGIDPSSPDIHLGHTVVLRRLRAFQDHGHQAVLIIGDYTAMVGDPSGKNKTRPQLTIEQVEHNALTYIAQAAKVLDMDNCEVVRNGEWFHRMDFLGVLKLAARTTVARMLERDDFTKRYKDEVPISLHEFLYPLMQGWDSVQVKADVELGGTDQLFNLLMGRKLQEQEEMPAQICITSPIIPGLDGTEKMSKSLGNAIGVNFEPNDMFGKVMSIPDTLMESWYTLLTREPLESVKKLCDPDQTNPREAKLRLARLITTDMHSAEDAAQGQQHFENIAKGGLPEEMPEAEVALEGGMIPAFALVKNVHNVSGGDARRLLKQGGVKLIQPDTQDEFSVDDEKAEFTAEDLEGRVLKVGKRHFYRLVVRGS